MLKRNDSIHDGVVIDRGAGAPVSEALFRGIEMLYDLGLRSWKSWQRARLYRQTLLAVSKLDARTQADIGWPWRYEKDHISRRIGP